MESMLVRHTGPRYLPSSSRAQLNIASRTWRSPSMVFMPHPHVISTSARTSLLMQRCASKLSNISNHSRGRRWQAAADELDEAETAVLVVGGGLLGMEMVRALIDAGLLVAAYQRGETFDIPEMFHDDIEEMGWDVIDVTTVKKVLEAAPFEAVVCTVGGGITRPDFDKDVPVKLVAAAKMASVKRFVLVSSTGNGDGVEVADEMTVEKVAEEAVKSSELNYTIIRPGGLLSSPPTGNGILTEDSGVSGLISRADVAALVMEVLFSEKSYGKILTAVDDDKDVLMPGPGSQGRNQGLEHEHLSVASSLKLR